MNIADNTKALEHFGNIEKEINHLISSKCDFTSFLLISIGIELLGAFVDGKGFSEKGNSDVRFKNGLEFFKNTWYQKEKQWIYKNYRGALVHQYRPGEGILLTSVFKNDADIKMHLTVKDGNVLFVLEQLFEDFKEAIEKLKTTLSRPNSYNKDKPNEDYIYKNKDGDTGGTKSNQSVEVGQQTTRTERRKNKGKQ